MIAQVTTENPKVQNRSGAAADGVSVGESGCGAGAARALWDLQGGAERCTVVLSPQNRSGATADHALVLQNASGAAADHALVLKNASGAAADHALVLKNASGAAADHALVLKNASGAAAIVSMAKGCNRPAPGPAPAPERSRRDLAKSRPCRKDWR